MHSNEILGATTPSTEDLWGNEEFLAQKAPISSPRPTEGLAYLGHSSSGSAVTTRAQRAAQSHAPTTAPAMATGDGARESWFYIDADGNTQGPFGFDQMVAWKDGGYLPNGLQVRTASEVAFSAIESRAEFSPASPPIPPSLGDQPAEASVDTPVPKPEAAPEEKPEAAPEEKPEAAPEEKPAPAPEEKAEPAPLVLAPLSFSGPPKTPEQIAEFKAYQVAKYELEQQQARAQQTKASLAAARTSSTMSLNVPGESPSRRRSATNTPASSVSSNGRKSSKLEKKKKMRGKTGSGLREETPEKSAVTRSSRKKYESSYARAPVASEANRRTRYTSSYKDGNSKDKKSRSSHGKRDKGKDKRQSRSQLALQKKERDEGTASHLPSSLSSSDAPMDTTREVPSLDMTTVSPIRAHAMEALVSPTRPSPRGKAFSTGQESYEKVMTLMGALCASGEAETIEGIVSPSPRAVKSKRDLVLSEIVQTEYTYVMSLTTMDRIYYRPLMDSKITPPELLTGVFSDVEMIMNINKDFVKDLSLRCDGTVDDGTLCVGDLFLGFAPLLKMYTKYVSNFDKAQAIVIQLRKDKAFSAFVDARMPAAGGLSLEAFLIMPVQRLPRYLLLLRELLKATPESHPDHVLLTQALPIVTAEVERVDREKYEADIKTKRKLAKKIKRSDPALQNKGRGKEEAFKRTTMIISILEVRELYGAKWKISIDLMVNSPTGGGKWDKFSTRKTKVNAITGVAKWDNAELFSVPMSMSEEVRMAVTKSDGTVLGMHPCAAGYLKLTFSDHKEHSIFVNPTLDLVTDRGRIPVIEVVCEVDFIEEKIMMV